MHAFVFPTISACCAPLSNAPRCTRRAMMQSVVAVLAASALPPELALADRTGRFSTRLTARRRYLPRVRDGVEAMRARGGGDMSYPSVKETMSEWLTPAQLLASGSVGEGAAAAPKRARLKDALSQAETAAKKADKDPAAMKSLLAALDEYEDAIGLSDTLPAS